MLSAKVITDDLRELVSLESCGGDEQSRQLKIQRMKSIQDTKIHDYLLTYHVIPYKDYMETGRIPEINKPDQATCEEFWDRCNNLAYENEDQYRLVTWLFGAFRIPNPSKKENVE